MAAYSANLDNNFDESILLPRWPLIELILLPQIQPHQAGPGFPVISKIFDPAASSANFGDISFYIGLAGPGFPVIFD